MQASSVKDLPDSERLKSAKLTGLRWDIDPVAIEYFRYLLNDLVSSTARKNSGSQQENVSGRSRRRSSSSSSTGSGRDPVKSTSAMLMSDRRLSVLPAADGAGSTSQSASHSEARRCSMFRQFSTTVQQQQPLFNTNQSTPSKALARWKKVPLPPHCPQFCTSPQQCYS